MLPPNFKMYLLLLWAVYNKISCVILQFMTPKSYSINWPQGKSSTVHVMGYIIWEYMISILKHLSLVIRCYVWTHYWDISFIRTNVLIFVFCWNFLWSFWKKILNSSRPKYSITIKLTLIKNHRPYLKCSW